MTPFDTYFACERNVCYGEGDGDGVAWCEQAVTPSSVSSLCAGDRRLSSFFGHCAGVGGSWL